MITTKIVFFILFFLTACGKFTYSPYVVDTAHTKLNQKNARKVEALSSTLNYPFKVALISDTHNYYSELSRIIKKINSRGISFVIHAGDFTNLGMQSEFETSKKFLDKLKMPLLSTIGNHDLLTNGAYVYRRMFGNPTYSVVIKDIKIIFFNNNNWESISKVPDYDWVKNELETSTSTLNILVAHVGPDDSDRFSEEEIQKWETLVQTHGVNLYVGGHDHNPGVRTFGGAPYITIGASNKKSYYEVTFDGMGVSYQKIDL